jgi:hypothetical protein
MTRRFVLVSLVPCLILAQDNSEEQSRASAKATVKDLTASLRFTDAAEQKNYLATRDRRTTKIHAAVDHYVSAIATASSLDSSKLAGHLSDLPDSHHYDPEYSGPPFARREEIRGKSALVIGYMLVRGGAAVNDSAVSIRAYTAIGGRFELADTTGQDLDGYGLFVRELRSPFPGEMWLLAWGPRYGFNGTRDRMRLYAFDGARFRTVWAPPDIYDGRITINETGFSVERLDEERYYHVLKPPYRLKVDYILVPDGPKAVSTLSIP